MKIIIKIIKVFIPSKKIKNKINHFYDDYMKYSLDFYIKLFLRKVKSKTYKHKKEGKNSNKVVYTVITGKYNDLITPLYFDKSWDYICFTDDKNLLKNKHYFWEIRELPYTKLDNAKNSRYPKILTHKVLSEYDYSLYIDANIDIISGVLFQKVNKLIAKGEKFALTDHFERNCIYSELQGCIRSKKDSYKNMITQTEIFRQNGFPENYGLKENNIIFRVHNSKEIAKIMEDWWYWIENYSKRDQLSLMYVLWKNNFTNVPNIMDKPVRFKKEDLVFLPHKRDFLTSNE